MFVEAETTIATEFAVATAALAEALADGGLTEESTRAIARTSRMPVGPARHLPERRVRVRFLEPSWRDGRLVLPLRWELEGWSRRLFPVLDANLELTAAAGGGTRLHVQGCYDPPLGGLGDGLDRVLLHRVADATLRGWLAEVGERLARTGVTTPRG